MKIMNPEERDERIQRQLEFLAASQAQHDARMAEISKTLAENSKTLAENSRQIMENSKRIADNSKQIAQLGDFILRIGRIVEEQGKQAQRTDDRLNALINVVERYFSNGKK